MILNRFFLTILLVFTVCLFGNAQGAEREFHGDENYLRMCIQWSDSTEYQTMNHPNSPLQHIYKFKVRQLFWGVYQEHEIYIATHNAAITQFNPERKLGRDYFWTLSKSEDTINGLPVYIKRGNF